MEKTPMEIIKDLKSIRDDIMELDIDDNRISVCIIEIDDIIDRLQDDEDY